MRDPLIMKVPLVLLISTEMYKVKMTDWMIEKMMMQIFLMVTWIGMVT